MNKIRKAIQSLQAMLAILTLVCASLVSLTACSDDDEPAAEVTYSWEFEEVSPSTPDFMDDKEKIEAAFKAALGATGTATSVTRQGTPETCDREVLEACRQAFNSLKDEVWQGRYTFTVTNVTTGTIVCTATFDADNENFFPYYDEKSYTASDLKLGDYYYSDGTWSDGGLRKTDRYGRLVEWAEPTPQPLSGKTVIGIVFYGGHHKNDHSDYSKSGIGQEKCHGYAVALTDVHNDREDRLRWEWKDGIYDRHVGTIEADYWDGYSNQQKIHEFVENNTDWEMKHFPAALACETYGNRTTDRDGHPIADGRYDWQKPFAAPDGTSGWFLPSYDQLRELWYHRDFLSERINLVRENTDDSVLREHIRWLTEIDIYWSSTEPDDIPGFARVLAFSNGRALYDLKDYTCGVRAVLAF